MHLLIALGNHQLSFLHLGNALLLNVSSNCLYGLFDKHNGDNEIEVLSHTRTFCDSKESCHEDIPFHSLHIDKESIDHVHDDFHLFDAKTQHV